MHKAGDGRLNMVLRKKEKEGTKNSVCPKKKTHKRGKRCTFLQPCTGSKMRTMKFDTIHGAYNPWYADRMPGLRVGEESWQKCSSHQSVSIFLTPLRIKCMGALSHRDRAGQEKDDETNPSATLGVNERKICKNEAPEVR